MAELTLEALAERVTALEAALVQLLVGPRAGRRSVAMDSSAIDQLVADVQSRQAVGE